MATYRFVTTWRLAAPLARVWEELREPTRWPEWWPEFVRVEQVKPPGEDGTGAVVRYEVRSVLPYTLAFSAKTTVAQPPNLLEARAVGELDGVGRLELHDDQVLTTVRWTWEVGTTKPWMNLLAPAQPLFAWNHDVVMRHGAEALARRLDATLLEVDTQRQVPSGAAWAALAAAAGLLGLAARSRSRR